MDKQKVPTTLLAWALWDLVVIQMFVNGVAVAARRAYRSLAKVRRYSEMAKENRSKKNPIMRFLGIKVL